MKILKTLLLSASLLLVAPCAVADDGLVYKYRVYFKDKKESPYSKRRPSEFLSDKAIARRAKWHLKIDDYDLPVSPTYIRRVAQQGAEVLCVSKWNNTALVGSTDSARLERLAELPFVSKVEKVFHGSLFKSDDDSWRFGQISEKLSVSSEYYGFAQRSISQLNGIPLHNRGFRGNGKTIAIIDGGFLNADTVSLLRGVNILGTHNFVRPWRSVYAENEHGTNVLSCMGANRPGIIIGTAPAASFWLLVSEDSYSETPAEEDTWAAAIEYADSVGADVVNSSLGYNLYDDSTLSVRYSELDGQTHLISRSASLAASRGMLLCNSAGNSGDEPWKLIGVPADARDMLTVGAIDEKGLNAPFSSLGNSADGRIKPDVMALGMWASAVRAGGYVMPVAGTSFSSPITAGMTACLMEALPKLKPTEIIQLLHECSSNAEHPDNVFGYGIPDYYKAFCKGKP